MKCMYPECQNERESRGLCWSHYSFARRLVVQGKTSWADMEARGVALPANKTRNGPKVMSHFMGP